MQFFNDVNIRQHIRVILSGSIKLTSQILDKTNVPWFDSWQVLFRDSYYKGKPDHAAATRHVLVYYM